MKYFISISLSFLFLQQAWAQAKPDRELLKESDFSVEKYESKRKVEYLFKGKNAVVKYNPVSLFFGGLLMFYQKIISKQLGSNCPYEISCSNFSTRSIKKYGLPKGILMTADRLTRCTRLAAIDINEETDFNKSNGKIIDNVEDYKLKTHLHEH
jgi:putative component of membrane protein insertase Oxa1/YidC/SpoIIIJ protein YidD